MKQFAGKEISTFLKAVDKHLDQPFRLDIIGGAAASLAFRIKSGTMDIDAANSVVKIEKASAAARKDTGLDIPLGTASIFDGPYEYESRMKRLPMAGLKRLQVFVPEKHDWVLMKIVRLIEKDIEDIKEVSAKVRLSKSVLLKRFLEEMTHVTGRRSELVMNFLTMMEELYGKKEADRMDKAIKGHKSWK